MSLEVKGADSAILDEYRKLKLMKIDILDLISRWVTRGTALHGTLTLADEKAEVIALRAQLDAEVSTTLGL